MVDMNTIADSKVQHDSTSSDDSSCDDYMVPIRMEDWPDMEAPTPPGSPRVFEFTRLPLTTVEESDEYKAKSATLQSFSSNIYEDLESSSDDGNGELDDTASAADSDNYSHRLDETLDNPDILKGLILTYAIRGVSAVSAGVSGGISPVSFLF